MLIVKLRPCLLLISSACKFHNARSPLGTICMMPTSQQQVTQVETVQRAGSNCTAGKLTLKLIQTKFQYFQEASPAVCRESLQKSMQEACNQVNNADRHLQDHWDSISSCVNSCINNPCLYPFPPVWFLSLLNLNLFPPPHCLGTNKGVTERTQDTDFLLSLQGLSYNPACSSWLWPLRETLLHFCSPGTACAQTPSICSARSLISANC